MVIRLCSLVWGFLHTVGRFALDPWVQRSRNAQAADEKGEFVPQNYTFPRSQSQNLGLLTPAPFYFPLHHALLLGNTSS